MKLLSVHSTTLKSLFIIVFTLFVLFSSDKVIAQDLVTSQIFEGKNIRHSFLSPKILSANNERVIFVFADQKLLPGATLKLKIFKCDPQSLEIQKSIELKIKKEDRFYPSDIAYTNGVIYIVGRGQDEYKGPLAVYATTISDELEIISSKRKIHQFSFSQQPNFRQKLVELDKANDALHVHCAAADSLFIYSSTNGEEYQKLSVADISTAFTSFSDTVRTTTSGQIGYNQTVSVIFKRVQKTIPNGIHIGNYYSDSKQFVSAVYHYESSEVRTAIESGHPIVGTNLNSWLVKMNGYYTLEKIDFNTGKVSSINLDKSIKKMECIEDYNEDNEWKESKINGCNDLIEDFHFAHLNGNIYVTKVSNRLKRNDDSYEMEVSVSKFNQRLDLLYSKVHKIDLTDLAKTLSEDKTASDFIESPHYINFRVQGIHEDENEDIVVLLQNQIMSNSKTLEPYEGKKPKKIKVSVAYSYDYDLACVKVNKEGELIKSTTIETRKYVPIMEGAISSPQVWGAKLVAHDQFYTLIVNGYGSSGGVECIKLDKDLNEISRKNLTNGIEAFSWNNAITFNGNVYSFSYEFEPYRDDVLETNEFKLNRVSLQ